MENRYFPLFLPSKGKKAVVFGGGDIATRRAKILCSFDFDIKVVSRHFSDELRELEKEGFLTLEERTLEPAEKDTIREILRGAFMVLSCTDDREVNRQIGLISKEENIWVSVADAKDECSFFFPGIGVNEKLTVGVSGDGTDHKAAARATRRIREILEKEDY